MMSKKRNIKIETDDRMVANFLKFFEKYKKMKGMDGEKFSRLYNAMADSKRYVIVPFEALESSDMGWVITKKKTAFVLGPHIIPMEGQYKDIMKTGIIMSKSPRDDHDWELVPQRPDALDKIMEKTVPCTKLETMHNHIGNASESVISIPIKTRDKTQHSIDHLTRHKYISEKEAKDSVEKNGKVRINK
jgi:hypothetical protein